MRVIFAGTPDFAVPTLKMLIAAGHSVVAVYTQPDRPAGRGRALQFSAVKQNAVLENLTLLQPTSLHQEHDTIKSLRADVMVVVAYGLILPAEILSLPRLGCLNVHASLLPRWRGAAPIQRAIAAGDRNTGVSIMQMDIGLDTGDVLTQVNCEILDNDSGGSLHDRLAGMGAEALIDTLAQLDSASVVATPQDESAASYAPKLTKSEGLLRWQHDAATLSRQVRAFSPWPGCYCQWQQKTLRVLRAHAEPTAMGAGAPGTILTATAAGLAVATTSGALVLTQIQLAGGKPLSVRDFLHGHKLAAGDRLE